MKSEMIELENGVNSILIVEDNPNHAELITESIKEANILNEIVCFDNGQEALQFVRRDGIYKDMKDYQRPGLILLDLKLPGMDGIEILQELKSDKRTKTIPVVILTSSGQERDIEECYKLGANSYITKPVSFGDFIDKVKAIPLYWLILNKIPKR